MLLEIERLNVSYGHVVAIDDLALTVENGEIVCVLGANSAGKSTLVNTISGIVAPSEGSSIRFEGDEMVGLPAAKRVLRGLIQVPERRQLFPRMTVRENLLVGGSNRRVLPRRPENLARVYDLFPRLAERSDQISGTLSGGEQQMVAVGRGLMADPKLLMLDEPSLGLAPKVVDELFAKFETLTSGGIAILLIEQNLEVALRYATRGYVLERGHSVMNAHAEALRNDDRVRRAYLGA